MAIDENDPRLKDMLRAIELGDLPEDLPADPEDYDDMGGIKSLDKGAPSIKMASETADEEFELELSSVIAEYNDLKSKGDSAVRGISLDQFISDYFSKKKMMKNMQEDRVMVAYGGRMQYGDGNDRPYEIKDGKKKFIDLPEKGYDNPFDARIAGDLEDRASYRELGSLKAKEGNPKPFKMDTKKVKELIERAKKEKKKLAMGGIAGVL